MTGITIEEGIVNYLEAHSGFGSVCGDRIYPIHLPQEVTLPAVVYQRISTQRAGIHTHDQDASGLSYTRIQFTVYAVKYADVKTAIYQLREALEGYKGTMGSGNTVTVGSSLMDTEADNYDPELGVYWAHIDFQISYQEK